MKVHDDYIKVHYENFTVQDDNSDYVLCGPFGVSQGPQIIEKTKICIRITCGPLIVVPCVVTVFMGVRTLRARKYKRTSLPSSLWLYICEGGGGAAGYQ